MEGHRDNPSHVHADRGQDASRFDSPAKSLVEHCVLSHGAWAYDVGDADAARYFERFDFVPSAMDTLLLPLAGTFVVEYLRARPDELARYRALALDIAHDGVIVR